MEEVEAGLLEGGIGWLAETILENLDADKLDDWIRQVGLADDTEKLRSEIESLEVVAADVKGRAIGNGPLARSLGRLTELLYDADDMVDELDYYRLQQQVQGEGGTYTQETLLSPSSVAQFSYVNVGIFVSHSYYMARGR